MDDPWIMTVKGTMGLKAAVQIDEISPANHKVTQKVHNGSSSPAMVKSPPKDSNLNHYKGCQTEGRLQTVSSECRKDDQEHETSKSSNELRENRNSKEFNPLDHRGQADDHKANRKSISKDHLQMSSNMKIDSSYSRSSCLSGVIYSLISDLQKKYNYNRRSSDVSPHKSPDPIEELKTAFEVAERTSPGISEEFICEMVQKLVPSLSQQRLRTVMDKITRDTS